MESFWPGDKFLTRAVIGNYLIVYEYQIQGAMRQNFLKERNRLPE